MTTISVRVDENLKAKAEALFESLGMNMSTAINVFLNAAVKEKGFPFAIKEKSEEVPKLTEEELFLAISKLDILTHEKAYKELAK